MTCEDRNFPAPSSPWLFRGPYCAVKAYLAARDLGAQSDLGAQASPVRARLACLRMSVSAPFLRKQQQACSSVPLYGGCALSRRHTWIEKQSRDELWGMLTGTVYPGLQVQREADNMRVY